MPFTLAHPLAVVPLARLGRGRALVLGLPALVAGSMAPDVPYFLPLPLDLRGVTHSLQGAPTVDVLVAVALLAVGVLVAGPVAELLPAGWAAVVGGWTPDAFPRRLSAVPLCYSVPLWYVALAVGAVTHVAWDAFTHPDGWVVERSALLQAEVGPWPVYHWLQYVCGVLGCAVLAWLLARAARRDAARLPYVPASARVARRRRVLAAAMVVGATAGALLRLGTDHVAAGVAFDLVTGVGGGAALAVLVYAVVTRLEAVSRPRRPAGPATSPTARRGPRSQG